MLMLLLIASGVAIGSNNGENTMAAEKINESVERFCQACRQGDIEAVRQMIARQPELIDADDQNHWRPIFHAALRKHEAVVRLLIEEGADVSAHDGYVLHYAAEVPSNHAIVRLLVEKGAIEAHTRPVDDLSRQLLHALYLSDAARVGKLLSRHPRLATTSDGRGDPPLHHAARNGETEIVRLLIASGADVNARNTRGHTVLYCAGGHGHFETVELLLDNGADRDAVFTEDGKNLKQWLAQYPDEPHLQEVANVLQRRKGDPPVKPAAPQRQIDTQPKGGAKLEEKELPSNDELF